MMQLSDILQQAAVTRTNALSNLNPPEELPPLVLPTLPPPPRPMLPSSDTSGQTQTLLQLLAALKARQQQSAPPSGGGSGGYYGGAGVDSSFLNGGSNPWGIDPNGMDLITRHGVTLDDDAMASLIAARRAGFNAFPFIGQGYRSLAQSAAAYYHPTNSLPHAPPGHSMHNYGLAFDAGGLPPSVRQYLLQNGWFWGNSFGDPPHYSYMRSG